MRDVHVVGMSDDGRFVLLAPRPDARPTARLPADDRLRAALKGDLPRPGESTQSRLTPREMQARLRAGETPEQVARRAGVPVAKVQRYAGPVLSERARAIAEAQSAVMTRARLGPSTVPMGAAVATHLAGIPGLKPDSVGWTARRLDDGSWVVTLSFTARSRSRTASWSWQPATGLVQPMSTTASSLGYLAPGAESAAEKAQPARPSGRRAGGPRGGASPRGTAGKAATGRAAPPAVKRSAAPAVKRSAAPAAKRSAAPAPKRAAPPAGRDGGQSPTPASSKRTGGRAAVPSWSDVLLGVRPPALSERGAARSPRRPR